MVTNNADVDVKLNPGLPWKMQYSTGRRFFSPANLALYGAENWALSNVDQKCLERFGI
jgi:hypothetical protein